MRNLVHLGSGRLLLMLAAGLAWSASASATTITLSTVSSDNTPASQLDATYEFVISGATELTLTVTNTTDLDAGDNDAEFNMNEVWWNATSNVTGLTLSSATHSVGATDVSTEWSPLETAMNVNGFGTFDFGLDNGTGGSQDDLIGPGEFIDFVFTIGGTGPFDMTDFLENNASGFTAAGKWVNCTGTDCVENDDSAFGAVPEPATALLLGLGITGLAFLGRARA